jgi:hypothetical protein
VWHYCLLGVLGRGGGGCGLSGPQPSRLYKGLEGSEPTVLSMSLIVHWVVGGGGHAWCGAGSLMCGL